MRPVGQHEWVVDEWRLGHFGQDSNLDPAISQHRCRDIVKRYSTELMCFGRTFVDHAVDKRDPTGNPDHSVNEVDVRPTQRYELATSHPRHGRQSNGSGAYGVGALRSFVKCVQLRRGRNFSSGADSRAAQLLEMPENVPSIPNAQLGEARPKECCATDAPLPERVPVGPCSVASVEVVILQLRDLDVTKDGANRMVDPRSVARDLDGRRPRLSMCSSHASTQLSHRRPGSIEIPGFYLCDKSSESFGSLTFPPDERARHLQWSSVCIDPRKRPQLPAPQGFARASVPVVAAGRP